MKDKKIKFLGITVFKRRTKNGVTTSRVCGIPVLRKVFKGTKIKTYLFGIRIKKKTISSIIQLDQSKLNVIIKISGGLGDFIINLNYVQALIKKFKIPSIRFYLCGSYQLLNFLAKDYCNIEKMYPPNDFRDDSRAFDLVINLVRFPQIKWANKKKIYEFSEELLDYVLAHERFMIENSRFFESGRTCDGQANMLTKIYGKNRVQMPDILGLLNIRDLNMELQPFKNKNLKIDYGITASKYITIHRGNDTKHKATCVKLWPQMYYDILVKLLKKKYPQYQIVQLGVNKDRCPDIENVDVNLVGKTSLDDIAFLLAHSSLHIDCEGGFAHLRHALHAGRTVVLFGPTDISVYGYPENINLRTNVCKGCEWVREKWLETCTIGMKKPPCMYSLIPEFVFEEIVRSGVLNV